MTAVRLGRIRPIYATLIALVLGIVASPIVVAMLLSLVGAAVASAFFVVAVPRRPLRVCPILVSVLLLLPFVVWGVFSARRAAAPAANDISRLIGGPSVWIRGTVV